MEVAKLLLGAGVCIVGFVLLAFFLRLIHLGVATAFKKSDQVIRSRVSGHPRVYGLIKCILLFGVSISISLNFTRMPQWASIAIFFAAFPFCFLFMSSWCELTLGVGLDEASRKKGWRWQLALALSIIGFAATMFYLIAITTYFPYAGHASA